MYSNGQIKKNKHEISVELRVILYIWFQDEEFHTYSPGLEITGTGKNLLESYTQFEMKLGKFFIHTYIQNSIDEALEKLGWNFNHKLNVATHPTLEYLIEEREEFLYVLAKKGLMQEKRNIRLSIMI